MSSMDLKGIAWVGNIYNKFEAMCLEVEETMYQDTAKYVESQVQTVGASVKRFYSDVMQDLLPPSCTDPEKVDVSLNACADIELDKKSKSYIKKDTSNVDNFLDEDRKKDSEKLNHVQEKKNYRRSNLGIKRISKRDNHVISQKSTSKNLKIDNVQVARDEITELTVSVPKEEKKGVDITEANELVKGYRNDLNLLEDFSENKETRLTDLNFNETCTNRELAFHSETHSDHSGDEEVFISHSDLEEDDNAKEPIVNETKEEKLEETCVLVDGERLSFISQTQAKNQSYKKKLRKAFLLKLGSGRKQEYEQLAAQYIEAGAAGLTRELQTANPSSCESEWELL